MNRAGTMIVRLPDTLRVADLQEFLADHGLALAPDGQDHYTAVPRQLSGIPELRPITRRCARMSGLPEAT
jgi:hypothetical protein